MSILIKVRKLMSVCFSGEARSSFDPRSARSEIFRSSSETEDEISSTA